MIHEKPHPMAGKTMLLPNALATFPPLLAGTLFTIEDWWDRVAGQSWADVLGSPVALCYAVRAAKAEVPPDNEVVYGKAGGLGHIVHISELTTDGLPPPRSTP